MTRLKILLSSLITILSAFQGTIAVQYEVINRVPSTPGGLRFTKEIGIQYCKQAMESATETIWRIFQQTKPSDRKSVKRVILLIDTIEGISSTSNNEIRISADYIAYYSGSVKTEITGVLIHEMTHVWQWDGNGLAPEGLIQGIADFIRLKAGYAPAHWAKAGQGDRWDQGYDITALFLNYCNSLKAGFVAKLNLKMRRSYSDEYFVELLGKTVDQLWGDYKAKYNNKL